MPGAFSRNIGLMNAVIFSCLRGFVLRARRAVAAGLASAVLFGLGALSLPEAEAAAPPVRSTKYADVPGALVRYAPQVYAPELAMTVEAWVWREDATRCETIVSQGFQNSFWLGFCPTLRFYRSGAVYASSGVNVPEKCWTHVAVSYDGSNARFYINGLLVATRPLVGSDTDLNAPLLLGSDPLPGGEFPFKGAIGLVRIWKRTQTAAEILYNQYQAYNPLPFSIFDTNITFLAVTGGSDQSGGIPSERRGVTEQVFGVVPRELEAAPVYGTSTVDAVPDAGILGAEEFPLRYFDGVAEREAKVSLTAEHDGAWRLRVLVHDWPTAPPPGTVVRLYYTGDSTVGTETIRRMDLPLAGGAVQFWKMTASAGWVTDLAFGGAGATANGDGAGAPRTAEFLTQSVGDPTLPRGKLIMEVSGGAPPRSILSPPGAQWSAADTWTYWKITPEQAEAGSTNRLPAGLVPLFQYHNAALNDRCAATGDDIFGAGSGYVPVRWEGSIFPPDAPQPPDTVPVCLWHHAGRQDWFTSSAPDWRGTVIGEVRSGYTLRRILGYAYNKPLMGTAPLAEWWNATLTDNFINTDPSWVGKSGAVKDGYDFVRTDAWIYPPGSSDHLDSTPFPASWFGSGARGMGSVTRPMLLIRMDFSDQNFPAAATETAAKSLMFGPAARSVAGLYEAESFGNYRLRESATYTLRAADLPATPGSNESTAAFWNTQPLSTLIGYALQRAAALGYNITPIDTNNDGSINNSELAIILQTPDFTTPRNTALGLSLGTKLINADGLRIGTTETLQTIAASIGGSLGTKLTGGNAAQSSIQFGTENTGKSIAASLVSPTEPVFHDGWHRMLFGWTGGARCYPVTWPGASAWIDSNERHNYQSSPEKRPVLLFDPARNTAQNSLQYLLIESRGEAPSRYDWLYAPNAVPDHERQGYIAWSVKTAAGFNPTLSSWISPGPDGVINTPAGADDQLMDFNNDGTPDALFPGADGLRPTNQGDDLTTFASSILCHGHGPGGATVLGGGYYAEPKVPLQPRYVTGESIPVVIRDERRSETGFHDRFAIDWTPAGTQLLPRLDSLSSNTITQGDTVRIYGMFPVERRSSVSGGLPRPYLILTQGSQSLYMGAYFGRANGSINVWTLQNTRSLTPGIWEVTMESPDTGLIPAPNGNRLLLNVKAPPSLVNITSLPSGLARMDFQNAPSSETFFETSTDLRHWEYHFTRTTPAGGLGDTVFFPSPAAEQHRFYRLRWR